MPRRRCVGCGRIAPKPELIRIVRAGDGREAATLAVLDPGGSAPGRGAYLCRDRDADAPVEACLRLALRRGGIQRTLHAPVALDPEIVESVGR